MGMLYQKSIQITDAISVRVPTVGQVMDDEDNYFGTVCTVIATPFEMMVQLDDANIDFTKIDDFDLFCLLFGHLRDANTSLVFGDLDLSSMNTAINDQTGEVIITNDQGNVVIDRIIHAKICAELRKLLHIEKENKKPGNEEAKRYLLERARKKLARAKRKPPKSPLEDYIVALVNTSEFPYNFETVRDITIYQFYSSLNQIVHKIKYDNTMTGFYAGTIKLDDLPPADRTWILNT